MAKDYYVILGIPRGESPRGIRSAFRDLARRHHPDRAGPTGTPAFRELVEAYRVLSDPAQRRAHDATLGKTDGLAAPDRARPHARSRPSPRLHPRPLFARPPAVRPSAEALLDRILHSFAAREPAKGERLEPLLCDVRLSPSEALRGGVLPVRMPVLAPCSACHGVGRSGGVACGVCDAEGAVPTEIEVPVHIPPRVRSGTVLETSLADWGVRNLWLCTRVRVSG